MHRPLFKPIDLYWAVIWTATKICYSVVPVSILLRYAALKGLVKSLASGRRAVIKDNLASVLGSSGSEKQIRATVSRHFQYLEKLDLIFRWPAARLFSNPERWPIAGLSHLEAARSRGKGVILVSTHFGYARLIKHVLKTRGYDLCVVGTETSRSSKSEKRTKARLNELSAFANSLYARLRLPALPGHFADLSIELNVRPLVTRLKQNGLILIMGDGTRAARFVNVEFLGRQLAFPTGYASIAMTTGASLLPVFAVDTAKGYGIELVFEEPLEIEGKNSRQQGPEACVLQFARRFETQVRRHPHLYKMFSRENRFERRLARSQSEVGDRYIPGKRRKNEMVSEL